MIPVAELKRWVDTLASDGFVAVNDSGLALVEIQRTGIADELTGAYYEIGGVPEDVLPEEGGPHDNVPVRKKKF